MSSSSTDAGDGTDRLRRLVRRLAEQLDGATETVETHISIVLLAGDRAWKFKKPVALGFLDFSTLALRREYCERELRLNRRYAPRIYLAVTAIRGSDEQPLWRGDSDPIEYAVCMRRFPDAARLDRLLEAGGLAGDDFAALGRRIGHLYGDARRAASPAFGKPELVSEQILETLSPFETTAEIAALKKQLRVRVGAGADVLTARWQGGWIRDCHGDLHLSNLVRGNDGMHPFDCIEFSDDLRYIDPASDIAFLLMDLDMRGHPRFANRFLNAYLATIGDYESLRVLPLYLAYRSLVRAKVAQLQRDADGDAALATRAAAHLALAADYLRNGAPPALVITHGYSGSGKSWLAQRLARFGFIHMSSDVERKRLAGMESDGASDSPLNAGLYRSDMTAATYDRLNDIARAALGSGFSIIVDATFLRAERRQMFRDTAEALRCSFRILDCRAPTALLRERVVKRGAAGGDASEADLTVLEHQLKTSEALDERERRASIAADESSDPAALAARLGAARPGLEDRRQRAEHVAG